jgi:hypothetical protein
MVDDIRRGVAGALARAMGQANHAAAVTSMERHKRELALECHSCGDANMRGLSPIELDDSGWASCECGYAWVPDNYDLWRGAGYKGRRRG